MRATRGRRLTVRALLAGAGFAAVALAAGGSDVDASFDTNDFEDTAFAAAPARALWNPGSQPGSLVGAVSSAQHQISFTTDFGDAAPWNSGQARSQVLYTAAQMGGTPRSISGFAWRKHLGGAPVAATYSNVNVLMGHNTSGFPNPNFTGSYADVPTACVSGATYAPNTAESNWITGPAFGTAFAYDGTRRAVFEVSTTGGTAINPWATITFNNPLTMVRQINNGGSTFQFWNHDVRFLTMVDRCEARSLWYDTQDPSPTYLDPIVDATVPTGTEATILYQGAPESLSAPGTPDLAMLSEWTSDPAGMLSGLRFLRFHVAMKGDLATGAVPSVERIHIQAGDRTSPVVESIAASPDVLWPANNKMRDVEILVAASDDRDPAPASRILWIASDEPQSGRGAGKTKVDYRITGDLTCQLRAERLGRGEGRTYTIVVECLDASGNAAWAWVEVFVPHDADDLKEHGDDEGDDEGGDEE